MRLRWAGRGVRAAAVTVILAGGCLSAAPALAGAASAATGSTQAARPAGQRPPRSGADPHAAAGNSHDFGKFTAARYLSCTKSAKITGRFALDVSGVASSFKQWKAKDGGHPFQASLSWQTTISASLDVSADKTNITCTPSKNLKKDFSARFVIDGVTIKLSPDFLLNITAKGDVTASDTTTESITVSGKLGLRKPTITRIYPETSPPSALTAR